MTKISSSLTSWHKRWNPLIFFSFLGSMLCIVLFSDKAENRMVGAILISTMLSLVYLLFKFFLWNLVDEVCDGGDFLLVRNWGVEERIELSNIIHVNASVMTNPQRITLLLETPSKLGKEISFRPKPGFFFNPFTTSPMARDLIERVRRARSSRAP